MNESFRKIVGTRRAALRWIAAPLVISLAAPLSRIPGAAAQTPQATPNFADLLPDKVRDSGKLNIAISLAYPPMEYSDPGSTDLKGADIDLAREVATRLGLEPVFQNMEFAQLIPSVTTGRADLIWTAMLDLAKRHDKLSFLDYFKTGDQFFAPIEFADKFKTISDLCGETVTVATGTNWVTVVEDLSKEKCGADDQINIVTVPSLAEQLLQMKQKRAVAAIIGFEGVLDLQKREPDKWVKVDELLNQGYYGIGFAKDATQLEDAVAAALTSMIEDGSYVAILDRYGLQEAAVEKLLTNAGQ
ncbi:MAG: transporter substrate-binding domain-containing protein [Thermomicrobiales bacterium]|nr:transporter substrate-binding domain-containing protein [Thermomicrobiales bacterium]